jgi:hypothetical protein
MTSDPLSRERNIDIGQRQLESKDADVSFIGQHTPTLGCHRAPPLLHFCSTNMPPNRHAPRHGQGRSPAQRQNTARMTKMRMEKANSGTLDDISFQATTTPSKAQATNDVTNAKRRERRWRSKAEAAQAQVREAANQLSEAKSTVLDLHNALNDKGCELEATEARYVRCVMTCRACSQI